MIPERVTTRFAVVLLAGAVVAALAVGGASAAGELSVDATPSGPDEAESTHALTATVQSGDAVAGATWNDVLVDYSPSQPTADVSNVGAGTIERIGIDRGDDAPGTQVDVRVTEIGEVAGQKDGDALRVSVGGNYTLHAGDEVVVVLSPVQNPQNPGNSTVELTINTQTGATSTTGTVTYEQHDATATLSDQTGVGDTVTVDSVTLSEGGFVAVQNVSGANPGAVRGVSTYLGPGSHQDVTVQLEEPVSGDTELVAQAYTDSNADRTFDYVTSGGETDTPYRNSDDNVIGTDSAMVTDADSFSTPDGSETMTEGGTEMSDTEAEDETTTGDSGPGFGVVVAAIAVLGGVLLATRRR
jgi:PGF-CTERM protein